MVQLYSMPFCAWCARMPVNYSETDGEQTWTQADIHRCTLWLFLHDCRYISRAAAGAEGRWCLWGGRFKCRKVEEVCLCLCLCVCVSACMCACLCACMMLLDMRHRLRCLQQLFMIQYSEEKDFGYFDYFTQSYTCFSKIYYMVYTELWDCYLTQSYSRSSQILSCLLWAFPQNASAWDMRLRSFHISLRKNYWNCFK